MLNDSSWSSPEARAGGLGGLGLAQVGSREAVDDKEFAKRIMERTIKSIIPRMLRKFFPFNEDCLKAADKCESLGTEEAVWAAERASREMRDTWKLWVVWEATDAAKWAASEAASWEPWKRASASARTATWAAVAAGDDSFLILAANIALSVLRELKSPGIQLL